MDPNEFIADFSAKGIIYAVTIRSPISRGTLKEIVSPKLSGSFNLITAEHIPGVNQLADFSVPVLADKTLSYIDQPVDILTGSEESKLEAMASQITVNAEEEKPLFRDGVISGEDIIVKRDLRSGEPGGEGRKCVLGQYSTEIQDHWYAEPHGAAAVPA
jgi:CO/xanthine dehydrogenase Mo-binding subunit